MVFLVPTGLALLALCLSTVSHAAGEAGTKPRAAYERTPYALPTESKFEVSGIAVLPDGRAALTLRKGEVWILENPLEDPAQARYRKFASGLHEPLGLTWHQGALYTTQRSEVTQMRTAMAMAWLGGYVCDGGSGLGAVRQLP